jgi:hypothetical protein
MADFNYIPAHPIERAYFEQLWTSANPEGASPGAVLTGQLAVPFFQRSGVDTGILRQIWSLCTPGATMTKEQFFSALRYICMVQNGDIPISKGEFSRLLTIFV